MSNKEYPTDQVWGHWPWIFDIFCRMDPLIVSPAVLAIVPQSRPHRTGKIV